MPRAAKRERNREPQARLGVDEASPAPSRPRSQRRAALAAIERQESVSSDDLMSAKPESDGEEAVEGQEKKARFVWTPELHRRFETAVHRLGVAQAKPQAIRHLMGCDSEEEPPTRQNIKSHLQKYRLLVQKQEAQKQQQQLPLRHVASHIAAAPASPVGGACGRGVACGRDGGRGGSSASGTPCSSSCSRVGSSEMGGERLDVATSCERFRQQQQVGLLAQLEIQAKLHEQMVEQRRTQASLGFRLAQAGQQVALGRPQLQRLAQHVLMQRMMLQHLCSMLHATTADLANDQMAQELGVDGSHPGGPPATDVFDGVGLDEDDAIPFPFELPEQPESGIEPLNQSLDYSHIEVRTLFFIWGARVRACPHDHCTRSRSRVGPPRECRWRRLRCRATR